MNKKTLLLISLMAACAGALIYAWAKGFIIIRTQSSYITSQADYPYAALSTKKKVTLFFWHQGKWHHETTNLVVSEDKAETITHLVSSWLKLLDEDDIMEKKISVESVLLSPSGLDAYISFNHQPFSKEATTFDSWMWIEGLLKTLRENGVKLQGVRFLVHHQTMLDSHLDFSKEWPITGFSEQ